MSGWLLVAGVGVAAWLPVAYVAWLLRDARRRLRRTEQARRP